MKKKILGIFILIITYIILSFIWSGETLAISQTTTTDINSIDSNKYPQIKEILQKLKSEHQNWNFKILYTDINWNEAIANESVGHGSSPRNLIASSYSSEWRCTTCGNKTYDNGNWYCASESAIAYMMDSRNFANYTDIFQFLELSYNGCSDTTLRKMVSGTFIDNQSYINTIKSSAQKNNVNPYYIVARIIQEQGKGGSTLTAGKGYNGQYVGYYNIFNIGATGSGKDNVILNGLKKAQSKGWTTLEASIEGGIEILASSYIAKGQNTLYFQKFDVENSDGNLYWHQYMQNLTAGQTEGQTLRKTFEEVNSVDGGYTFIIPLFKNMPSSACPRPGTTSTEVPSYSEQVRVNVTGSLRLRNAPNGSTTVAWVYKDEIITRLSKGTEKINGTYWDYVMKSNGTKGYAARETYDYESTYKLYLVPLETQNPSEPGNNTSEIANDKVKINSSTNKVTAVPGAMVDDLKLLMGNETVVKNSTGEVVSGKIATGYTINDTYTVSVLGDINGDGEITPSDYMNVKNHIMNKNKIDGVALTSADINKDGKITPSDYMNIKNYIMNKSKIEL